MLYIVQWLRIGFYNRVISNNEKKSKCKQKINKIEYIFINLYIVRENLNKGTGLSLFMFNAVLERRKK